MSADMGDLPPDATRFLSTLRGRLTFQTVDDLKQDKTLSRIVHDASALHILNERGAGVFVMVNEGDGQGRTTQYLTG